jgi:hypothetical protein
VTNELTIENARNLTDAELLKAIYAGLSALGDALMEPCIAILVLKERDVKLPWLPKVFDYAEHIVSGALSPVAALTLCRFPFTVAPVMAMPRDLQERLARGEKVKIAFKDKGAVRFAERSIWEMSAKQLRLAFADGKIVPWKEQGTELHTNPYFEEPAPKRTMPRYDRKTGQLVIGRARLAIEDLHQALAEAGQMIVPIYGKAQRKG